MDGTSIINVAVAYNHIHILIQSPLPVHKISQKLFGAVSYYIRKEYPDLVNLHPGSLWGGKSCLPIKDETHLRNSISYIARHQPDNTKI